MAIILPAAAPTDCSATIAAPEISRRSATPCWKRLNIRLLTVLLPAMNAPSAPIVGAKRGQMPPTLTATHSAMLIGILAMPSALTPELI